MFWKHALSTRVCGWVISCGKQQRGPASDLPDVRVPLNNRMLVTQLLCCAVWVYRGGKRRTSVRKKGVARVRACEARAERSSRTRLRFTSWPALEPRGRHARPCPATSRSRDTSPCTWRCGGLPLREILIGHRKILLKDSISVCLRAKAGPHM